MSDPTRWALSRLVGLCRTHHRWVEEHRTTAILDGLLIRHGVDVPAAVPVRRHGEWALLTDEGLVIPVAVAWRSTVRPS